MTYGEWRRALVPKTRGSRNLLAQLWPGDEPFFILPSSITGIIGNTAQSNYAAGKTFEDALSQHAHHHLGIRATGIDFGDLENYLHRYQHGWNVLQTILEELRLAPMAVMRGTAANGQPVPAQFVLGLGNKVVYKSGSTGFELDAMESLAYATKEESVDDTLKKATSFAEAAATLELSLRKQIAISIGVHSDQVDVQRPLPEFGGKYCYSLTAVKIRNRTLKEMRSEISVFELLSSTPMADLAVKIASRSELPSDARLETMVSVHFMFQVIVEK
ncbi:Highly reducing polyketide synthase alnA [Metarhizium brunneum]|uniref:Highly reducing polyketide synthase alnA n=1 Tax=Metarhizium brunneum TaxID=500148 RepID=A0A7D5UXM9_9HYPO|nr:Highly reducing polyketide synthase alnA [Metarhizium brunneum]